MRMRMPPNYCRNRSHSLLNETDERWRWVWREKLDSLMKSVRMKMTFCNLIYFSHSMSFFTKFSFHTHTLIVSYSWFFLVTECIKLFFFSSSPIVYYRIRMSRFVDGKWYNIYHSSSRRNQTWCLYKLQTIFDWLHCCSINHRWLMLSRNNVIRNTWTSSNIECYGCCT